MIFAVFSWLEFIQNYKKYFGTSYVNTQKRSGSAEREMEKISARSEKEESERDKWM